MDYTVNTLNKYTTSLYLKCLRKVALFFVKTMRKSLFSFSTGKLKKKQNYKVFFCEFFQLTEEQGHLPQCTAVHSTLYSFSEAERDGD